MNPQILSVALVSVYKNQRIIDPTGTKTWQIFFRMFVMAKIFKELFTPTKNTIAIIVRCVLGAILNDWLRRIQTKQHDGT